MAVVAFTGFELGDPAYDGTIHGLDTGSFTVDDHDGLRLVQSAASACDAYYLIGKPGTSAGQQAINLASCWLGFRVHLESYNNDGVLPAAFAGIMSAVAVAKLVLKIVDEGVKRVRLYDSAGTIQKTWDWGDESDWHYCEIFASTGGTHIIYWDGVQVYAGLLDSNSSNVAYLAFGRASVAPGVETEIWYDDVYVDSATRHGRSRVSLVPSKTEETNEWDSGGMTEVDVIPVDPESSATVASDGATLQIKANALENAGDITAIHAAKLTAVLDQDDATSNLSIALTDNGVAYSAKNIAATTSIAAGELVRATRPSNGGAWDAALFGTTVHYKATSGALEDDSATLSLHSLKVHILYTDSTDPDPTPEEPDDTADDGAKASPPPSRTPYGRYLARRSAAARLRGRK